MILLIAEFEERKRREVSGFLCVDKVEVCAILLIKSNNNMAATAIWRQQQYGDNNNMATTIWRQQYGGLYSDKHKVGA